MTSLLDVVDRVFRAWALEPPAHSGGGDDPRAAGVVAAFVAADEAMRGKMRWRVDNAVYTPTDIVFDMVIKGADRYRERRRQSDDCGLRFMTLAADGIGRARRHRDPEPLFVGLAGLALTGGFPDWRECVPILDDTRRAATEIGADQVELLRRAWLLAVGEMRALLVAQANVGGPGSGTIP